MPRRTRPRARRSPRSFGVVGDLVDPRLKLLEQVRERVLLARRRRQRGEVVVLALEVRDEDVLGEGHRIVTGGRPLGILLEGNVGERLVCVGADLVGLGDELLLGGGIRFLFVVVVAATGDDKDQEREQ